jgi:hypothetical protein
MNVITPVMTSAIGGQPGTLNATPGGAGAPGDDRHRVLGHPFQLFDKWPAAVDAEHAAFVERRVALDCEHIFAFVFLLRLLEDRLGLMTRRRHDGVVIVERDHRQDDVLHQRMGGADEAFRAAGALEAMHPDDRHALVGFQRLRHRRGDGGREAEARRGQTAKLVEAATRDALSANDVIKRLGRGHDVLPGVSQFSARGCGHAEIY